MSPTSTKRIVVLLLLISTITTHAQSDSIFNKIALELNTDFYAGKYWGITQNSIVNHNISYGAGIYLGYNISSKEKILFGVNYLTSNYQFKILRRNVLQSSGDLKDTEDFRENIELFKYSFGFVYSYKISSKSTLDLEFQKTHTIDEKRERSGYMIGTYDNSGPMYNGIDYSNDESSYGFKIKYNYELKKHIHIGLGVLGTRESIKMPEITNNSKLNLSVSTSISYVL